jgi:hypothetical protein
VGDSINVLLSFTPKLIKRVNSFIVGKRHSLLFESFAMFGCQSICLVSAGVIAPSLTDSHIKFQRWQVVSAVLSVQLFITTSFMVMLFVLSSLKTTGVTQAHNNGSVHINAAVFITVL